MPPRANASSSSVEVWALLSDSGSAEPLPRLAHLPEHVECGLRVGAERLLHACDAVGDVARRHEGDLCPLGRPLGVPKGRGDAAQRSGRRLRHLDRAPVDQLVIAPRNLGIRGRRLRVFEKVLVGDDPAHLDEEHVQRGVEAVCDRHREARTPRTAPGHGSRWRPHAPGVAPQMPSRLSTSANLPTSSVRVGCDFSKWLVVSRSRSIRDSPASAVSGSERSRTASMSCNTSVSSPRAAASTVLLRASSSWSRSRSSRSRSFSICLSRSPVLVG